MTTKKIPATNPDDFCKSQKANGKIQHFTDSTTGGLRLRITAAGKKVWIFGYSAKTATGYANRSMTLGPFKDGKTAAADALSVKQARGIAGELKTKIRNGEDPAAEKRRRVNDRIAAEAARMTVADVYQEWIKSAAIAARKSAPEIQRMMNKDVLPVLGKLGITDVTKTHVMKIVSKLQARGERMPRVVFDLINQMMNFALNHGYIDENPCASIDRKAVGTTGKERDRILSEDEIRELFRKLPASGLVGTSLLAIPLQLATCCRIGELLQARWADVDFDRQEWFIPETKNGKAHTVRLSAFALDHLRQLHTLTRHTGWLYPNRNETGHIDTKAVTKQIRDRQRDEGEVLKGRSLKDQRSLILESGRGDRWTPHDLRRTGASLLAELGVLPDVIERCLNHTEENKVKRTYNRHDYREEMTAAWDLLGDRLALLANPEADNVITLKRA